MLLNIRVVFVHVLIISLFSLLWTTPSHANLIPTEDSPYLTELLDKALKLGLENSRYWQLLLHYRKNTFGGYTSDVDDPGFFLAENGKTNPKDELIHTIRAFFSSDLVGRSQQHAQCAFIARYHWLMEKLSFDHQRFPKVGCKRFNHWFEELNAESVTLIFPSAFMNNPASMFGHTLLRLDQKGQTSQTRLLAYTLNYAADVTTENGFAFAYLGIVGGFKGYYSTHPYYLKVREYRDFENRDIWEYHLNLQKDELKKMLMHAWEMGNAYFDYYFFKENCAYNILALLEVARPDLALTNQFIFWTIPADTVRLITEQPNLVGDISFRAARSNKIKQKYSTLTSDEKTLLHKIITTPTEADSQKYIQQPRTRQAFVLDLASDYLQYQKIEDKATSKKTGENLHEILKKRSLINEPSKPFIVTPVSGQPEQGHKTSRIDAGIGWRNDSFFEELTLRAGYHDLLDPNAGYTPDTQIELLKASIRHYEEQNEFRLEEFTVADIISLSPTTALFRAPSWKMRAGIESVIHDQCKLCYSANINAGVGIAMESSLLKREVAFAFTEIDANYGTAFDEDHRIGGGGTLGVLADITSRWKVLLTGTYLQYPFGDQSHDIRTSMQQRFTIQKNGAIRLELNSREEDTETLLLFQAFF